MLETLDHVRMVLYDGTMTTRQAQETTVNTIAALGNLMQMASAHPAGGSPSGAPMQRAFGMVNGHPVQAFILDFGAQAWFEVDRSIEMLTEAQAAEKVSA